MSKVISKVGTFTDYAGIERQFVMVAVSIEELTAGEVLIADKYPKDSDSIELPKTISIGVSVARPGDEFDEAFGVRIAQGKAEARRDHAMFATDPGMINTMVVEALLEQECEYFKQNPGRYIAGYEKDKHKYMEYAEELKMKQEVEASLEAEEAFIATLNDDQRAAYEAL